MSLNETAARPALRFTAPRICIVTQWFPPEPAPIGQMLQELARNLALAGWDVTVITGFPNHPSGNVHSGYRKRWRAQETAEGVGILRTWIYTSPRRAPWRRLLTFASFTLTSALALLGRRRFDLIFAVAQPLSVALVLPCVARLSGARLILNIQDLHPDVPIALGLVRNRFLISLLRAVERFGYRHADALSVISPGFAAHALRRGARDGRVAVIPNWIDTQFLRPGPRMNSFRAGLGLGEAHFVVLYAGTIGLVSGAEVLIGAARLLRSEQQLHFLCVGEGPMVPRLREMAGRLELKNVSFLGFQDRSMLNEVQNSCDVAVVTLAPGHGHLSVPSKVLGYMAAGRAVVAAVDASSETARMIQAADAGAVVAAGDAAALAGAIVRLRDDAGERERLARNGRAHVERELSVRSVTVRYEAFLRAVLDE